MINKSNRQLTLQMSGAVLAIRMRGGGDCLWLHMYLDMDNWQMTCDSDVGSYAFYWSRQSYSGKDFIEFCTEWLADEHWLLRKCVGERHASRDFKRKQSEAALRAMVTEYHANDEDFDIDVLNDIISDASGFDESAQAWAMAVHLMADMRGLDLPEEWYECVAEDYTPMQKRFAEICRETIVPELKRVIELKKRALNGEVYRG